ncbi:FtsK-like domain-containing protein [Planctomycetes bacterium Poly30]|uniref:FtsK-like domain-containing protein n=1 Tax=Saltatorellus ferox TaxID=2528018 RepID=A0A518F066_9BACT|nr:FtsK-like domain-containing protein [Planctomycetes bacterium Poly30]
MSANFDDDVAGPFDGGPFDGDAGDRWEAPPGGEGVPAPRRESRYADDFRPGHGGHHPEGRAPGMSNHGSLQGGAESSGLELIGGLLFLAGCLPAAAVAKAILDGTNLAAPGLGGTAALAAKVAHWLGPWAALITSAAIAVLGALMVLGSLRTEPLRRVAGVLVSGLGLAAVMGAVAPQTTQGLVSGGGQIGFGTGGAMASWLGTWAGVLLGLAVIAGAVWLGFVQSAPEFDEDDGLGPIVERDELPRASAGSALAKAAGAAASVGAAAAAAGASIFKREPRTEAEILKGRANRQRRVSNKKVRRAGAPVTLGDALARGGTEGVSHDEAAALAPDDKTLAYMEDVWRRASHSMEQPQPIPPSPYPEDVRLKGLIPEGAAPLEPRPGQPSAPAGSGRSAAAHSHRQGHATPNYGSHGSASQNYGTPAPASDPYGVAGHGAAGHGAAGHGAAGGHGAGPFGSSAGTPREDVAPFDFDDELSAPKPLNQVPPPSAPLPAPPKFAPYTPSTPELRETDPFGTSGSYGGLSPEEAAAYKAAILREGASATGPSELPHGVKPFVPRSPEDEASEAAAEASARSVDDDVDPGLPSFEVTEVPAPSGMGTTVAGAGSVLFPGHDGFVGKDPMAKQAMQAGAMPASVSPPPRPAWEVGYDDEDDDVAVNLSPEVLETIPDVDPSGRWQRREEGFDADDSREEYEDMTPPSMSVLDELLAQAEASESAFAETEARGVDDGVLDLSQAAEAEAEAEVEVEAEVEAEVEPEAELEIEDAIELEAEEISAEDEPEEDDEEAEYEEEAELEEDEEEEYEYVDEDGNPIDPADLGEEYEFVEEDEDAEEDEDEDEEAEYEEYEEAEEDDEDADDEEAAEYEEEDGEESEEDEDEPGEEESEYEEYEDEDEEEAAESEDVILEPQAPPAPVAPSAAALAESDPEKSPESGADEAPEGLSGDGQRLLDAGRLVVTKDRAAVSVIQKGFDVEFAEACSILEALFAEGLIGPYQEGKKRAILMSLDEWEGRFAHS